MKKNLIFCLLSIIYIKTTAQVTIKSFEKSMVSKYGLFGTSEKLNETQFDSLGLSEKKIGTAGDGLYGFAISKKVDLYPISNVEKDVTGDTTVIRHKLIAKGARSITIYFDQLTLSKNAELYLYSLDGKVITGPITFKENIIKGKLWGSNSFLGNSLILELKVPTAELFNNDLHIAKVSFGQPKQSIKNSTDSAQFGNFGYASPCNINVLCSQGDPWAIERKAICLIQFSDDNGTHYGSGALINNTCNSGTPYVLTAWHNTQGNDPSTWQYIFNWWSPTCTNSYYTQIAYLFNGASLVATYEPTDFSLLLLNQTPDSYMGLSYLGWSRSSSPPTIPVGISHPQGDQMKIAFDDNAAVVGDIRLNTNTAWRVLWTSGMTEQGSSGSPLFDQNHFVVGQLYSGTQPSGYPCNQQTGGENYGRFDLSWNGGGTSGSRLKDWLDPSNLNPNTLNTFDPINQYVIQGVDNFCSGSQSYSLPLPTGSTASWGVSPSGLVTGPSPTSGSSTSLTFAGNGVVTLTATITSVCGSTVQVQKNIQVGTGNPPSVTVYYDASCGSYLEAFPYNSPIGTTGYIYTLDNAGVTTTSITDPYYGALVKIPYPFPSGPVAGYSYTDYLHVKAITGCGVAPNNTTADNSYVNVINIGPISNDCGGPGGGGVERIKKDTVLTDESVGIAKKFSIYPNPAHSILSVSVPPDSMDINHTVISLMDAQGRILKRLISTGETNALDLNGYANGVYLIEITDGKKKIIKKILKN